MLQFSAKRAVTVVCGAGGSGKSTFAIRYLLNAPDLAVRFCFDPEDEYSQRLKLKPARTGIDLDAHLARGWVIFDPHSMFPGRVDDAFAFFCEWVFRMSERLPGRKVLVIDEAWKYTTPTTMPQEFANIVLTGRKRGLSLLVNTQQPQLLNGKLLGEVSEFVSFQIQFDGSLDLLSKRGFDREEVKALAPFSFVARTDQGGELRGRIAL